MDLSRKVRQVARRLLQAYGTSRSKKYLWNREFAAGRWDYIGSTPGDCIYSHVERYAGGGSILDLGCGSGSTATELLAASYECYFGVDISDVAINRAREKAERGGRGNRSYFLQGDIVSYQPSRQFNVILLRDSLYYLPVGRIKAVLERYSKYFAKDGVFIVRMAWCDKYKAIVNAIETRFVIVEKQWYENPNVLVLVFR